MEITENDFVTVSEAAKILDCSEFTVRKLCRENTLKGFKKLGKWYIFKTDIVKFVKGK